MRDPKKRLPQSDAARQWSRQDLERQIMHVASSLVSGHKAEDPGAEGPVPCWIEPRQLIRILAPFVSMN